MTEYRDSMLFEEEESWPEQKAFLPTWAYISIFITPALLVTYLLISQYEYESTATVIIALAVMNGSINAVIAVLTIRLDGQSKQALDNLEHLSDNLENASDMVESFTTDLNDAKLVFNKIGVDLGELELEPIADVVEKLKENKDGFNEILDHLKEVDVTHYIDQAKRINWQALLDSAEEIMGFIENKNITPTVKMPKINVEEDMFTTKEETGGFFARETPTPKKRLNIPPPPRKRLNLSPPSRR